ncbi:MAG: hypothetical protein R3B09_08560 [Nannocystaceae bacterium]
MSSKIGDRPPASMARRSSIGGDARLVGGRDRFTGVGAAPDLDGPTIADRRRRPARRRPRSSHHG